jgi:hypothetical protein
MFAMTRSERVVAIEVSVAARDRAKASIFFLVGRRFLSGFFFSSSTSLQSGNADSPVRTSPVFTRDRSIGPISDAVLKAAPA